MALDATNPSFNAIGATGSDPPGTVPNKNDLEKTGLTVNSPYGPAIPQLGQLLGSLQDRFAQTGGTQDSARQTAGLGITTANQYGQLAGQDPNRAGALNNEYQGLLGPTNASQNLSGMASEGGVNPYWEAGLQGQLDQTTSSVKDAFSGLGRFGSNDFGKSLGTALGNIRSTAYSNQWDQGRQRQLQASGQIDSANLAQSGARRGILGDINNVAQQNWQNKYNALGGQTAAQGAQIAGQGAIQDLGWGDLKNYAGILGPLISGYGAQGKFEPQTPIWQKILGGLSAGAGIIGSFV